MKHIVLSLVSFFVITHVAIAQNRAADDSKWRVLVDKVVSASTQPQLTNAQIEEVAKAGFNVFVPRQGGKDLKAVEAGAKLCAENGIKYMAWMRGSAYTKDPRHKMVWADGVIGTKALASPNSDKMWEGITTLLEGHARLSLKYPSIVGTFLDFENYDTHGGYGHCYSLSYDDIILDEFAKHASVAIPKLPAAKRYPWLVNKQLHSEFASFQKQQWVKRCRQIRKRIDAINPAFRLAIYPVPGPLFLEEAALQTLATQRAPLLLADACTYGRPLSFLTDQASLNENRRELLDHLAHARTGQYPFQYMGGLDPIVEPNNPEFVAKNADMIASICDGYWVFYEGPTYGKDDHKQMFEWFRRANESIKRKRFHLHHQRRFTKPPEQKLSLTRTPGKKLVLHEGVNIGMHKTLNRAGKYQSEFLRSLELDYLAKSDIVWIQSGIRWMDCDPELLIKLRTYVEKGGSLLISHLGWAKTGCAHQSGNPLHTNLLTIHPRPSARLFPEIATWSGPTQTNSVGPFAFDTELIVRSPSTISMKMPVGAKMQTGSPNHMVLQKGKHGTVIVEDSHGNPVCAAGQIGKGRVILSGCFYGYWEPSRPVTFPDPKEKQLLFAMLDWLADN